MRVLITGAGGYLGTCLVRQLLLHTTWDLTLLDRFDWGVQPLASVLRVYTEQRVRILRGDVRDGAQVGEALAGVDAIIHLAGIVGYPACDADPQDADTTNIEGTRVLCRLAAPRPIICASTGSCYGKVEGLATEATPINPLTRYGRTKAEAERIVLDHGGTALRLATLFGVSPHMRWDLLIHDFCRRAVRRETLQLFEGDARRTFLHVDDAAQAFHQAVVDFCHTLGPGIWNVGAPHLNLTKRQIVSAIQVYRQFDVVEADGRDPDGRDYAVDYTKIAPYWTPTWSLESALPGLIHLAEVWK